jgi:uncharacterized membrane protein
MSQRWIVGIMVAVLVWGLVHAVGTYLFDGNLRRSLVLIGSSVIFVEFWLVALWLRARRQRSAATDASSPEDGPADR